MLDLFKTPRLYFYKLVLLAVQPFYIRIFRLRWVGKENIPAQGAYLIVANHSHLLDPFFIGSVIRKPIFQMASNEFFRKPLMRRFMWAMGAFPRKKGFVDFKSIKYAIHLVRQGYPLAIYPEGGRNWDGETLPVLKSTAKLVKLLQVPLVSVVSKGNYKAYPRWANQRRKSPITIHFSEPVTFDRTASDEEVIEYIQKSIYNNDNYTSVEYIRGRSPAEGLTRLLWRCPECRQLEALTEQDGHHLSCGGCGRRWEVNLDCCMREEGTPEWKPVKEYADRMFSSDEISGTEPDEPGLEGPVYLQSREVVLYHEPEYPRLERKGSGRLFLTDRGLVFTYHACSGSPDEMQLYSFEDIRGRSTELNTVFQIVLDSDIARFEMQEESCYKWELFYDYIRRMKGFKEEEQ
jgi:1-acyl-sn-glycerol-3-phosphate acyltransferase